MQKMVVETEWKFLNNMKSLQVLLDELIKSEALSLHLQNKADGVTNYYVPYMMNDAVESYVILFDCHLQGEIDEGALYVDAKVVWDDDKKGVIFYQENGLFAIWFEKYELITHCYQYHMTGHFWRSGQEQWRRLVYLIGTIYDKYLYLGDEYCNDCEKQLMYLSEFEPFRVWSPIDESFDIFYEETKRGSDCMLQLAKDANDKEMVVWTKIYQLFPSKIVSRHIAKMLTNVKRVKLYEYILSKLNKGSIQYPQRVYDKDKEKLIKTRRDTVIKDILEQGFCGEYPNFKKGMEVISAYEEHPYTIGELEYEGFDFGIHLMSSVCEKYPTSIHGGFFVGKGNEAKVKKC